MQNIQQLIDINFKYLGNWFFHDDELDNTIQNTDITNFLYAFVIDDNIQYIGKSTQSIKKRFAGYKKPGKSQTTNIKNNKNIKDTLKNNQEIKIYIFNDNSPLRYGKFNINLAAGLEDSLINSIKPPWNG